MKVIQVNDVHTSDRPPRWRKPSYNDELFAKLEWVVALARKERATLLFCGDLFHHPAPTKVSHDLVNRWLTLLDVNSLDVVIVPGNHDLAAGRVESLDRQPLGTLRALPNVTILTGGQRYLTPAGNVIAGVEWNYQMDAESIAKAVYVEPDVGVPGIDILATHAAIARTPNPHYETIQPDDLVRALGGDSTPAFVCYGHLHPPEKPYRARYGTSQAEPVFVNPGALSRGALTANDLARTPQVAVIDLDRPWRGHVEYVEVEAALPSADVFLAEQAYTAKAESEAVEAFVESMRATTLEGVSVESLVEDARRRTDDPEVVREAESILRDF